jgi:Cu/Ag efflux protein CusF
MNVNVITRNFGTLVVLAIVGGAAAGVVMARKDVQVDLGTVAGHRLALTTGSKTPTGPQIITSTTGAAAFAGAGFGGGGAPVAGAGNASTGFGGGGSFAGATTGTVDKVDGSTVTVIGSDGTTIRATVSPTTTISSSATITVADLKVGDTVTVVGEEASDQSVITATQVTAGDVGQTGAFGRAAAFGGRQGGAAGAGVTASTAVTGTTGAGRPGGAAGAGAAAGTAATGTAGAGRQSGAAGAGQGAITNFAFVSGTISKIDGNTLTVTADNGQIATIDVAPTTRLRKVTAAKLSDITYGEEVTVMGQPNPDGTVAATSVELGSTR